MITSSWLIWASCDLRNSALVSTLACGIGRHRRLDGGVALLRRDALGELGGDEEVAAASTFGTSLLERVCNEISQLPAIEASS